MSNKVQSFCPDTLNPTPSDWVLMRQQHSPGKLNCYGYRGETCRENAELCMYTFELHQMQQLEHKADSV